MAAQHDVPGAGRKRRDLTDMDFGALHVFRRVGSTEKGASLWACYCGKCGETVIIEGQRLLAGKTDCGCTYRARRADLTGKHFGALQVIKRTGAGATGDALYLCRCDLCGQEKELPATTIRKEPKSCGCQQYNGSRMKGMSELGVAASVKNGVNVYSATKKEPTKRNKLGIRGVTYNEKRHCYIAYCTVHGEKWFGYGFDSAEAAKAARDKAQNELFLKYGVEIPMLTVEQYAEKYGYSINTVYAYVSDGTISPENVEHIAVEGRGGKRTMIRYDAVPVLSSAHKEARAK